MMQAAPKESASPPAYLSGRTTFLLVTVMTAGTLASVLGFMLLRESENSGVELELKRISDLGVASLQRELETNLEVLGGLARLFVVEPNLSRRQFAAYARPAVDRLASIQALEWIPRVASADRSGFEERARREGLPEFEISERAAPGEMVPAAQRAEHFPVYYLEPLRGNEAALGFDLASSATRMAALVESRETGEMRATAPVTLVQEKAQQQGFLVFVPIFSESAQNVTERRKGLQGFVLGVFRTGDLFSAAIADSSLGKSAEVEMWLTDTSDPEHVLHRSPAELEAKSMDGAYERELELPGRRWRLLVRQTPELVAEHRTWQPHTILASGLALTVLMTAYLNISMTRHGHVRHMVTLRTAELEARQSETRAILDTAIDAIITADGRGTVKLFNPAAERMFGYRAEDVIGHNLKMLMPEPYHSKHDGYLARYRETGEARIIGTGREVTARHADGATFPIQLSVGEMRIGDESVFVGVIMDMTLQKEAQRVLRAAKEAAEQSNRQKSEFLNLMSHELRTPLTVILGYLPLLENKERLPEPATIVSMARDIETSGSHLLALINDLLDLSKIEAEQLTLNRAALETREIVFGVVEPLRSKAHEKGIELDAEADAGTVNADPLRLRQILINLIGNAIKFTDHGGVMVRAGAEDSSMVFSVQDTGCGIEPSALPMIFEKFHQVDSSSTRAAGGTGLGLAITKRLVELHGGTIGVTSQLGEGSVFTVSLPSGQV